MPTLNGFHKGNITVSQHFEVLGSIEGDVTVVKGGILELKGTVLGSCHVLAGGVAIIFGSVRGSLENDHGDVDIWGVVQVLKDCDLAMPSKVRPGARIDKYEVGTCG